MMVHTLIASLCGAVLVWGGDADRRSRTTETKKANPYSLTDAAVSAHTTTHATAPSPQGTTDCPYSFAPMEISGGGTAATGGPPGDEKLYSLIGSLSWLSAPQEATGGDYTLEVGFHEAAYGPVTCFGSSGIDCNNNGIDDECDIAAGISLDRDGNCQPDECDDCVTGLDQLANACRIDCNAFDGLCQVTGCGESTDLDGNGLPDVCDPDCDGDGIPNVVDTPTDIIYVDADATMGANNGDGWADAYTDLQDAICEARSAQPYCTPGTCKTCQTSNADVNNGVSIEIWVAEGVYTPAESDREDHFRLTTCVALYGGFAGSETSRDERDPVANLTVLSGDLLGDDDIPGPGGNGENSFHVVDSRPEGQIAQDSSAILDGFYITGGNANGSNLGNRVGGGMIAFTASPTVANTVFEDNFALVQGGAVGLLQANTSTYSNCRFLNNTAQQGGAFSAGNSAAITVSGCEFVGNTALLGVPVDSGSGGAFFAQQNSEPILIDCEFRDNHADRNGGAIFNSSSSTTLINVAVINNDANDSGGGIFNTNSSIAVQNSTIAGNHADNTAGPVNGGGGIANDASSPFVVNSILYGNTAGAAPDTESAQIAGGVPGVAHSIVEGLDTLNLPVSGNFDADPLFANLPGGDVTIASGSPAVDRGDRFQLPTDPRSATVGLVEPIMSDLGGGPRVNGPELDVGAFEVFVCTSSFSLDPEFGQFSDCATGPNMSVTPGLCGCFDFDNDDHVGVLDYGMLQILIGE